jgi:hypothetical protein
MKTASSFAKSAICIAAMALASAGASAMEYSQGTITSGKTYFDVKDVGVGSFADTFSFTIASPLFTGGSVSDLPISFTLTFPPFSTVNLYNITGLNVKLYGGAVGSGSLLFDLDSNPLSSADYKAGSGLFDVGNYYFAVSGTGAGALGGKYQFAVTAIAPVPEPESYALLLAGLGVMGTIALRRNRSKPH